MLNIPKNWVGLGPPWPSCSFAYGATVKTIFTGPLAWRGGTMHRAELTGPIRDSLAIGGSRKARTDRQTTQGFDRGTSKAENR